MTHINDENFRWQMDRLSAPGLLPAESQDLLMNPSGICLEQIVKLLTGSKHFCALLSKEMFGQKCAVPLPELFAPDLHESIVGWGIHAPTNRSHAKLEKLPNEQRLQENECILRGKL